MDLDNEYYIIKFQAKADFEKVLAEDLKLGINFINKMDVSWVKVLHAKYKVTERFLSGVSLNQCSHVWRSMMSIWEDLKENVAWRIGSGRDVKFWIDSWLGTLVRYYCTQTTPSFLEATIFGMVTTLLANEKRCRHQLMDDSSRQICGNVLESIEHVSRECPLAQAVLVKEIKWEIIFASTLWRLWKVRNLAVFTGQNLNGESDHFKLNMDGGVDVNSRNAMASGLIRCSNGNWVLGYGRIMGVHLVLDVELQAIIDGMNMAWDIGMCHLIVECD
ncbi:hypothetical protein Golob_013849, partial [Gossypium lobatum]|nr:hypothetical protein [Gossypium lobatum]